MLLQSQQCSSLLKLLYLRLQKRRKKKLLDMAIAMGQVATVTK
jgi:hypothetical protein